MTKFIRFIFPVLLISWMVMIFFLSNQTAVESDDTSGSFIKFAAGIFIEDFDQLSPSEQDEIIAPFQFIARKGAHFTIYFILALFAFLSLITYSSPPLFFRAIISFIFCILYSVSDEIHQTYISGRSGELRDVLVDSSGSFLAITILFLIDYSYKNKNISEGGKMRKKDLLKLNEELFRRCDDTLRTLEEVKAENARLKNEIMLLQEKIETPLQIQCEPEKVDLIMEESEIESVLDEETYEEIEPQEKTPLDNLEEKMLSIVVSEEKKYGAQIIGKIVVEAAKYCNKLSADADGENTKELINLILGRTEIAKAEILNITESDSDLEEKISLINNIKTQCIDYFQSILGQR